MDVESTSRRYTPGPSDGLGDRLLTSETGSAPPLELLRFKPEFATAPGFEAALRKRLDLLGHVRHPAFAVIRAVESGEHLALVSNKPAGIRLSDILRDAKGSAFAFELIRQIAPALAMLHEHGAEIAHGAVTPERIVVTKEGRLVLIEHVLGQALQSLELTVGRARNEIGLAVPDGTGPVTIDQRLDVIQLGFIALSLALGRRLQPAEYPSRIRATLDEFTRVDAATAAKLRPWLERALQVGPRGFANAKEANEAYIELMAPPKPTTVSSDTEDPVGQVWHEPSSSDAPQAEDERPAAAAATTTTPVTVRSKSGRWVRFALAGLGVVAVVEGAVIAGLFNTLLGDSNVPVVVVQPQSPAADAVPTTTPPDVAAQTPIATESNATGATVLPGTTPASSTAPLTSSALPPAASTSSPAASAPPPLTPAPAQSASSTTTPPAAAADPAAPPPTPRPSTLQITSAIELQVFENGQLVGLSTTPISLPRGSHQLEFVNETLGFRTRQTVNLRGTTTPLAIALPNGRISINAVPWADVTIDGKPAGQTPLANIEIPIGSHEIVFRHPQLGEQRQTAVVKVEGLTRVSATLQGPR